MKRRKQMENVPSNKEPGKLPLTTSDRISNCLQLALLLEVSAYPKPGNVHRTSDFHGTRYEHFIVSAVALGPHFKRAAQQGMDIVDKRAQLSDTSIGETIRNAVADVASWQHGGNTVLGSIILLTPMATAAGLTLTENKSFSVNLFRRNLRSVVESTTPEDAVNVYDAIRLAQPGGLGKTPRLDVTNAESRQKILQDRVSLFHVFQISASWDSISNEWVSNYHVTFDVGYPYFVEELQETGDVNAAAVDTYLKILSEVPDTLIARKAGTEKARWVSAQAVRILKNGGLKSQRGKRLLLKLDRQLRDPAHKLNPGTTADITSAVLAVAVLNGYRP